MRQPMLLLRRISLFTAALGTACPAAEKYGYGEGCGMAVARYEMP